MEKERKTEKKHRETNKERRMKKGKKLNKRKQIYEYIMREKRLRKICTKRIKTKGQIEKDVKNRQREKDGDIYIKG